MADILTLLEMAEELNKMERPLQTGFECDFHDSVLQRLRAGYALSPKQEAKLREIYDRYLGDEAEVDETIDDVDY
jgi:hypothetical protein